MSDKSGGHRLRPARLRLLGVLLAMLGIVALAACSSTSTTATEGGTPSTAYQKALAYAQCIRAHGVPNYPDPNSKGQFIAGNGPGNNLPSVSPALLQSAGKACQKLAPPGPQQGSQGQSNASSQLKFSKCMRSHGVPNFPDPNSNGSITLPPGMNAQSPRFQAAEKDCQSLMPMNPGGSAP